MKKFDFKNIKNIAFAILPVYNSGWTVKDLIGWCLVLIRNLVPILIGLAVIVFLYGVMLFIMRSSAGNVKDRAESIKFMIWGIVGITVMVSVWGLVTFVTTTFGVNSSIVPQFPVGGTPTIGGVQDNSSFR